MKNKIEMTTTNRLLMTLTNITPFSWLEIKYIFDQLQSIDAVVSLCDYAASMGYSDLMVALSQVRMAQIENELLKMYGSPNESNHS